MEDAKTQSETTRPLALVTGASNGIGRAFVELLAREGYDIIAVARSREAMEEHGAELSTAFGASLTARALDLTVPGAADMVEDPVLLAKETC